MTPPTRLYMIHYHQETFLTGSEQPEETNHLLSQDSVDQPLRDPLMEQHISLGSSGLIDYKHNDTQVSSGLGEVGLGSD
ncbi:hypothetical protein E2C01_095870 [Portunus trituberculatus]|uniref:Uncharacterized protein n=1 Tax=Portunus trituberculatus TaxID=210409 RepID=A0A5B7JQZ7_PORTR|nr:hypothetical protein [Portunus trituberculatus]